MSLRADVLLWAVRVTGRPSDAPAHVLLDIRIDATIEEAQEAFHKIARTSHPDLHRAHMNADELEQVTSAYARVAGAYQEFRNKRAATTRMRPIGGEGTTIPPGTQKGPPIGSSPGAPVPAGSSPSTTVPPATKTHSSSGHSLASSANMNSKALIYYRKVEMCLRRGDLKTAVLQMRMAIAADPQSAQRVDRDRGRARQEQRVTRATIAVWRATRCSSRMLPRPNVLRSWGISTY
jgi:hypothetical protein